MSVDYMMYRWEKFVEVRRFRCYFWFVGWPNLALGVSVCLESPNVEIHLPFGFLRIGWCREMEQLPPNEGPATTKPDPSIG